MKTAFSSRFTIEREPGCWPAVKYDDYRYSKNAGYGDHERSIVVGGVAYEINVYDVEYQRGREHCIWPGTYYEPPEYETDEVPRVCSMMVAVRRDDADDDVLVRVARLAVDAVNEDLRDELEAYSSESEAA